MRVTRRRQRKKGGMEYEVALLALEFTVLVVLIFTLSKIISNGVQPHFQIAYANAELLRSTIDSLCAQGTGSVTLEDWSFPQPQPMTIQAAGGEALKSVIPKFMIKAGGDPNFLLYYEAYPPPQAFGWELYQTLDNRLIMPLRRTADVSDANRTIINEILTPTSQATHIDPVLIPNIMLGNKTDESFPGSIGTWKSENFYSLGGYDLMSEIDKSLVKYRVCGQYALCMKTHDGIIRMPLPNCEKKRINYIQMYRETSDVFESIGEDAFQAVGVSFIEFRAGTWTAALISAVKVLPKFATKLLAGIASGIGAIAAASDLLSGGEATAADIIALFTATSSDFALASPCEASMKIEVGTCSCSALQDLKLFEYDKKADTLNVIGSYKTCWDRISNATGTSDDSISCIKIGLKDESGFCRTRNVVLPFTTFTTSFGHAVEYNPIFQAVKLLPGDKKVRPGLVDFESGWVWPGER